MLRAPGTLSVPEPLHHSSTPSRKRGPLGTAPSHTGCHPFLAPSLIQSVKVSVGGTPSGR